MAALFLSKGTHSPPPSSGSSSSIQSNSLIDIAKICPLRVHVLAHLRIRHQLRHGHDIVQQGRRALPILLGSIIRQRPVLDVLLLPQPPQPVDIGMVKEEQRIWFRSVIYPHHSQLLHPTHHSAKPSASPYPHPARPRPDAQPHAARPQGPAESRQSRRWR